MNNVYIYLFDKVDCLEDNFISKKLRKLPASRQEKCNRYKHDFDKKACIVSYLLLLKGLKEHYGVDTKVEFVYNEWGKPFLKDYPHIFFNISHCKLGVVCAVADFSVGIDIQDICPFDIAVAERVCSVRELEQLKISDNPEKLFCKMWTEKESCAKLNGTGINDMLKKDLPENSILWQYENEKFILTLCESKTSDVIFNITKSVF